ncbi:putative mitochondrial ADP/ATP mitochondrial carrier-like protein [Leptomonas pyrrhocoris]|uniref:ADP/ATP translocase n=1 Tax=Leptomonas pyrrhocoris TaxID=157538 RepID=A0A0M9FWA5_LEPPY|nr:putative mitochondrial ADP/ATP mitochondrial carrier-like protein [Leptomonas pyrrhocoris]XP_015655733.1 putative mitochondrial ADP/ATP mitochondrial carrier-like protein [Leptomonas pyrrhocoris]KPA77293.1 putative mitochondrial ADP/ATP mitochondrial carrier-like protein [Leptomonas pyrrhocoris]KPA77294.1 putative mitochondrial ADP/ATP mitochondrial carrier-like protein [Leptomonas pyrrhocoris]|eukprot:XP_015655732.1 putative mitochondrial ADP/ATP mitochondrial carrier-like protein [Leptomonas pyrrhocoris]
MSSQAAAPPQQAAQQQFPTPSGGDAMYAGQYGMPNQLSPADLLIDMVIRAVLDLVQRSLVAPIDRVMVLTAVEGELVRQGRLPAGGFRGIRRLYQRLWRKEGKYGLLRGVMADAVLTLPSGLVDSIATNAVFVCLQRVIPKSMAEQMSTPVVVALSLAATSAAVWVATPYNAIRKTIMTNYMADIVAPVAVAAKTQMPPAEEEEEGDNNRKPRPEAAEGDAGEAEEEAYRYATASETARQIYRRKGWGGFYRGAAVEPVTVCAYRGLYLVASVLVSERLQMSYPYAVARGLAIVADVITQPLEVVSRRLVLTASDDDDGRRYGGVVDCARTIVREEGVTALWSGLRFRLMVSGASIAVRWAYIAGFGGTD